MSKRIQRSAIGFTIVELLIVVVVIAILAAIVIVAYNGIRSRSTDASVKSTLSSAAKKLETYRYNAGNNAQVYPTYLTDADISAGSGPALAYNYLSASNYYCLESTLGSVVYHETSLAMSPQVGSCAPTNGLIAWWPLNGDAKNYSTGDTSAIISNATIAAGQNGAANGSYSFNGTSTSNIDTNHTASRNTFSFTIWAYPTVSTGYRTPLSETRDCCTTGLRGFELKTSYTTAGASSVAVWAGGSGIAASAAGTTSTLNTWNFFAGTYNGSTLSFYKDGALVSSSSYVGTLGNPTQDLFIGTTPTGNGAYAGRVDDVRVYDRALTATEVANIYSSGAE